MPLDSRWVERIFARLLVRYGAEWVRMWEGVEPDAVKADWADVLGGVPADAIAYALENLPADRKPPTAQQFKHLCMSRPLPRYKALPAPDPDPAVAAAAVERLNELMRARRSSPGLGWAYRLRDREQQGERLTQAQRDAWREVIREPQQDADAA